MHTIPVYILVCIIFIIGCNINKSNISTNDKSPNNMTSEQASPSEVGGCKVKATILSIDTLLNKMEPSSPCAKSPCIASIKIDEIIKMGALCGPLLYKGDELKVYFDFTLS